jgi:hypothetical protein
VFSVNGTTLYSSAQSAPVTVNLDQGTTAILLTASPPSVTGQPQNVTITGAVMVTPYQGAQEALPGVDVYVNGGSTPITTNSSGVFMYTADGVANTASYSFSVNGTTYYQGDTQSVTVQAVQAATAVTANPSQSSVTLGSQSVTFTGQVTDTPAAGMAQGIGAGVQVYVSVNGGAAAPATLTTDANGDYSYTVPNISANSSYIFSVQSTSLYSQAQATPVSINVSQMSGTVKVTSAPAFVTYGSATVTFTGTATGGTPGVGVGANVPIYLSIGGQPASQVTTTTDAGGDFSYQVSDITTPGTYTFSVAGNNLYTQAQDAVQVPLDLGTSNMTAQSTPADTDLSASSITLSGNVSVTPYGSTSAVGVPEGTTVYLTTETIQGQTGPTAVTTTSDTNGDFSYTPPSAPTKPTVYDFSVDAGTFYTEASMAVPVGPGLASNLTVTANPASVTEGSQSVTFSGTLTGVSPATQTTEYIPNAPVDLSVAGVNMGQVTMTGNQGTFTYTASDIDAAATYEFSVPQLVGSGGYTEATEGVPVGISPAVTRIFGVKVTPAHLKYGQKATLQGTVQYQTGPTTWAALSSTAVQLAEGTTSLGTVKTNANGSFTASLPTTHGAAWKAVLPSATLLQQASAVGSLVISVPMKANWFKASLSVLGQVTASGCLDVTAPVGYGPQSSVQIQYATRSRGPWRVLGRLELHDNLPAGKVGAHYANCTTATEAYFSGPLKAADDNAYYRADFPANDNFQGAVSGVIHAWRYQTKITNYSVTPHTVNSGQTVTISGRLWHRTGSKWVPYAKKSIEILYNQKGTSYWNTALGPVRTNSKGEFRQVANAGKGNFVAVIYCEYGGSTVDLAYRTAGISVTIKLRSAAIAFSQVPVMLSAQGAERNTLARHEFLMLAGKPAHTIR